MEAAIEVLPPKYRAEETDPGVCHWCRSPFQPPTLLRFPITTEVNFGSGWELVSVCFACFKEAVDCEGGSLERHARDCAGCGEPMSTPLYGRFRWGVCSSRCYQRALRKSKREWVNCTVCKALFIPARTDARHCSNRCRQWAYRLRKRQ